MTSVKISSKNMQRARISMKRLYISEFGDDSLSNLEKEFTRDQMILIYAKNLKFWNKHLPEIQPNMTEFTSAKHALCSNAIEQLRKKCDKYNIRKEVEASVEVFIQNDNILQTS